MEMKSIPESLKSSKRKINTLERDGKNKPLISKKKIIEEISSGLENNQELASKKNFSGKTK